MGWLRKESFHASPSAALPADHGMDRTEVLVGCPGYTQEPRNITGPILSQAKGEEQRGGGEG